MSLDRPTPRLRLPIVIGAMIIALALQTTVLHAVSIGGVKPDLVLVVALCAGLIVGPGAGALFGACAGLLEGYAQGAHIGSLGLSRALAAFLAGTVETHVMPDNVIVPMITVFLGSLAAHAIYFVVAPEFPIARPLRIGMTESLLNMLFTPPLYLALTRWGLTYRR